MNFNFNDVFLMDDDEYINFYNEDLLSDIKEVNDVSIFSNCNEAIQYLEKGIKNGILPGLWFVDINMPIMNGFEFLDKAFSQLKVLDVMPKIYMLSSSTHHSDKEECVKRTFIDGFLSKPLLEDHLKTLLLSKN